MFSNDSDPLQNFNPTAAGRSDAAPRQQVKIQALQTDIYGPMAKFSSVWIWTALVALLVAAVPSGAEVATLKESAVLTLDASNFSDVLAKHPFIVVQFYSPGCEHCVKLTPEYEKAAAILSEHDPPIILAKVNAHDEVNKELASKYAVLDFPTLKILRIAVQEYSGPLEADGIVQYLKKQVDTASAEIKSLHDAGSPIGNESIFMDLTPKKMPEPIPEVNNEPVNVVAADSFHDLDVSSKKNGPRAACNRRVGCFIPGPPTGATESSWNIIGSYAKHLILPFWACVFFFPLLYFSRPP